MLKTILKKRLTTQDAMNNLGLSVNFVSDVFCKLYNYTNYSWCAISAWLLVFISLERCLSVVTKTGLNGFFSSKAFEFLIVTFAIAYNTCLYVPFLIYTDLAVATQTSKIC